MMRRASLVGLAAGLLLALAGARSEAGAITTTILEDTITSFDVLFSHDSPNAGHLVVAGGVTDNWAFSLVVDEGIGLDDELDITFALRHLRGPSNEGAGPVIFASFPHIDAGDYDEGFHTADGAPSVVMHTNQSVDVIFQPSVSFKVDEGIFVNDLDAYTIHVRAFHFTAPVPEPSTLPGALLGLALAGWWGWKGLSGRRLSRRGAADYGESYS